MNNEQIDNQIGQFLNEYERAIRKRDFHYEDVGDAELPLLHMLRSEHKKGTLPPVTDAHWFHKSFRQVDVTECGHRDLAIWYLISKSKIIWGVFEKYAVED